jgi:protein SCO1/2
MSRVIRPERMDTAPEAEARPSLFDLVRLNRWFGGHATLLGELAKLESPDSAFSVLDVGAASGDHARAIKARFPRATAVSLDLSAAHLADAPSPRVQANAFRLPFADRSFDYVCANLFLHHFEDDVVVRLLRGFGAVARRAVLVTDLERHWIARSFLPATRRLFGWSPITLHDGVISVDAAFKPEELRRLAVRAGLPQPRVRRRVPWFRIALVAAMSTGCARQHRIEGLVLAVDRDQQRMTVSHRAVPGFMPAMAMPVRAASATELAAVEPGARVEFHLRLDKRRSEARGIRVTDTRLADEGFRFPVPPEKVAVGSPMPDFALTDQLGRPTRLADFRGRLVVVNFLYTRCPLPEVCPRLAASFASLRARHRASIPDKLVLLSITLDPRHDTPPVLARYAESIGARGEGWWLLTGDVDPVARRFGLAYWPEEGVIVHTSATALIGPDGRLLASVEGSQFPLEQLSDLVSHHLR